MGRIFGILCIAVAMWIGMQIYLEGARHALGSAFDFSTHTGEASTPAGEATRPARTAPQRAGDAVRDSLALEAKRRDRTMPE